MNAIVSHIFINSSKTVNCTNDTFHLPKVKNSLLFIHPKAAQWLVYP